MFEVTFAKPVRTPGREAIDDLGTQLDKIARFGFYNLNLDIYIDTDRVAGLGRPHHAPRPPRRGRSARPPGRRRSS